MGRMCNWKMLRMCAGCTCRRWVAMCTPPLTTHPHPNTSYTDTPCCIPIMHCRTRPHPRPCSPPPWFPSPCPSLAHPAAQRAPPCAAAVSGYRGPGEAGCLWTAVPCGRGVATCSGGGTGASCCYRHAAGVGYGAWGMECGVGVEEQGGITGAHCTLYGDTCIS